MKFIFLSLLIFSAYISATRNVKQPSTFIKEYDADRNACYNCALDCASTPDCNNYLCGSSWTGFGDNQVNCQLFTNPTPKPVPTFPQQLWDWFWKKIRLII